MCASELRTERRELEIRTVFNATYKDNLTKVTIFKIRSLYFGIFNAKYSLSDECKAQSMNDVTPNITHTRPHHVISNLCQSDCVNVLAFRPTNFSVFVCFIYIKQERVCKVKTNTYVNTGALSWGQVYPCVCVREREIEELFKVVWITVWFCCVVCFCRN